MNTTEPTPHTEPARHGGAGGAAIWLIGVLVAAALAYLLAMGGFLTWLVVGIGQAQNAQQQCTSITTAGEAVTKGEDSTGRLEVRVATWNTLKTNSAANVIAGLRRITTTADIVGVQEFRPTVRAARVRAALPGFTMSTAGTSNTIMWRTANYTAISQGRIQELGIIRREGGPVGTSIGPKYLEWVHLKNKQTGGQLVVLNNHLLPFIETAGHPNRARSNSYLNHAQHQIAIELRTVDRFRSLGLPVVVTKDANWSATASARTKSPASPYIAGAKHGLYTSWQILGYPNRGTRGPKLIDSVASTTALLVPTQQRIGATSGSDHAPVNVALADRTTSIATATEETDKTASRPDRTGLTADQLTVAQHVYATTLAVGREHSWTPATIQRAFLIAISTAMKESTLGANPRSRQPDSNGDAGIYAQRTKPGWYGTINQVNDPAYGTRVFLTGRKLTAADIAAARAAGVTPAGPAGYVIPGLIQIHGWTQLSIGDASHRIQRSAFPTMPAGFVDPRPHPVVHPPSQPRQRHTLDRRQFCPTSAVRRRRPKQRPARPPPCPPRSITSPLTP